MTVKMLAMYPRSLPLPTESFFLFGPRGTGEWERGKTRVGIDVKASTGWRREFGNTLAQLREEGQLTAAIAVYAGKERAVDRGIRVLPFAEFARELVAGRVLG